MSGAERDEEALGAGSEPLTHETIRHRALSGAVIIAGRNFLILGLALGANVILAHELSPQEFGLVAFGAAILGFVSTLSDGGLGSALLRSSVDADRLTLRCVLGFQLTVNLLLYAVIAAFALTFSGLAGQLTAVMALSLPLGALSTPAFIVLERSLAFRTIARVEVLQAVVYYVFAVVAVSLGLGVWGLAAAAVVRTFTSVTLLFVARRDLFFFPAFSLTRIRPLLRFGVIFQANGFATLVRDQGLNIGVAAIAGTSTLGIWTLARRLLELPFTLFQVLWRVSFPATSQLMRAGSDIRPLIERGTKSTAIASGFVLATAAAGAPGLVPAVFGSRWYESGIIVAVACAGLAIGGPISVATAGYLYASGEAASVLVATAVHAAIWLGVGLGLLALIGPVALAVGLVVGAVADAVLLARATQRRLAVPLFRPVLRATLAAFAAGGAGIAFTLLGGSTLASGIVGASIALVAYLGLLLVLERAQTVELVKMAVGTVGLAAHRKPVPTMPSRPWSVRL